MKLLHVIKLSFGTILKIKPSRIFFAFMSVFMKIANAVFIGVFCFQEIINGIFYTKQLQNVAFWLFIQLLCTMIINLYEDWYNRIYRLKTDTDIKEEIQNRISKKCIEYDLLTFTKSDNLDRYKRVITSTDEKCIEIFESVFDYIASIGILLLAGAFVVVEEPVIAISIIFCYIVDMLLTLRKNKVLFEEYMIMNRHQRKEDYFIRVNYVKNFALDSRVSHISSALQKQYDDSYAELQRDIKKYFLKTSGYEVLSALNKMMFGAHIPYILLGVLALITRKYTAGEIAVLVAAMIKMRTALSGITMIYPKLKQNMLYMNDCQEFMNYEPGISRNEEGICPETKANSIRLQNVTFGYDKEHPVLRNINMEVKGGERVAIVGYNGAGKTTLVKVMLRLYLPDTGSVFMDDITAETYNLAAYRERFAIAFQESNTYALPVAENVLMDIYEANKKEQVEEALNKAGLKEKTEEYAKGILCEMTQEFDDEGMELSGGQTQKMALSRVYAKESGIVILDEPSSALDPISENEMIKTMMENTKGKTLLLISHRLSAVRDMDRIYFMEKGEIVEVGNHKELLERGGKYARMWYAQADKYQVNNG